MTGQISLFASRNRTSRSSRYRSPDAATPHGTGRSYALTSGVALKKL